MSTDNLLDKDLSELMDADFMQLTEAIEEHSISEQSVVMGTVLRIDEERVLIDINYKAEGFVSVNEFTNEEAEITLIGAKKQIGDIEIGDFIEEELKAEGGSTNG